MAKGTVHLNVEFSAVFDEDGRFGRLATLLGLVDADHARGKCEHLWVACTRRGESDLPQWLVEQVLGEHGPDALVESGLAGWAGGRGDSKTRRMRISGAEKHCLWMARDQAAKAEQSSKGGKSRAATASRAGGKFTSRAGGDSPAQTSPSKISTTTTTQTEEREDLSHARARVAPTVQPDPEQEQRRAWQAQLWQQLEDERRKICAELREPYTPLLAFDPGKRDLATAFMETSNLEQATALFEGARNAIAVAGREALLLHHSTTWLTGAVFSHNNLRRLAAGSVRAVDAEDDRRRAAAARRGGPDTTIRHVVPL